MKAIQQQASMGDVSPLTKKLSDKQRMKQVKQGMVSFQHPETQSFETVGEVKTTAETNDKYLVYSINCQQLNKPL